MDNYKLSPQQKRHVDLAGNELYSSFAYVEFSYPEQQPDVVRIKEKLISLIDNIPCLRSQLTKDCSALNISPPEESYLFLDYQIIDLDCSSTDQRSLAAQKIQSSFIDNPSVNLISYIFLDGPGSPKIYLAARSWLSDVNSLLLLAQDLSGDIDNICCDIDYFDLHTWLWDAVEEGRNLENQSRLPEEVFGVSSASASKGRVAFGSEINGPIKIMDIGEISGLNKSNIMIPQELILACYTHLLAGRNEQNRVCVAYDVIGRGYDELNGLFGPIAKQIPIQVDLSTHVSYAALIEYCREKIVQISQEADTFDWINTGREQHEGCEYGFAYYDKSVFGKLLDAVGFDTGYKNKLQVIVGNCKSSSDLYLVYDERYFDQGAIRFFALQFVSLLQKINQDLSKTINKIPLIDNELADLVLRLGNGGIQVLNHLNDEPIINFSHYVDFYAQTKPDALALYGQRQQLVYRELAQRTNQLANFFLVEGIQAGSRIGLCLPRSEAMVICMVAAFKAGCSFVPIDPGYPPARIQQIINGAKLAALVTSTAYMDVVSESVDELLLFDLEKEGAYINECSAQRPPIAHHALEEAYTIFTSGSTGIPKGVSISHKSLLNYVMGLQQRIDFSQIESLMALSTVAADLGYTAIFGALATGRQLRIISEEKSLDAPALANELCAVPVDCLKIVPSHLRALLAVEDPINVLPKKVLIFGGEKISHDLIALVQSINPQIKIYNHYGPTETTIGVAARSINLDEVKLLASIPIGTALTNSQFYVLNKTLHHCGVGVEGELYIAGTGLALGYVNDPARNALLFIPDPFVSVPGSRMYRTGDRVIMQDDGSVIFKGRTDYQLKLRGYRIELEEIENTILKTGYVDSVVVTVYKDDEQALNTGKLIAYFSGPSHDCSEAIVTELKQWLPNYMVPGQWIWLSKMPLNANGKINRNALPKPEVAIRNTDYEENNPIERALLGLLEKLLGIKSLSKHDNFFSVGGDSITAIQFVAKARQDGFILKPKQVFDFPTIEDLAKVTEVESIKDVVNIPISGQSLLSPIQSRFFQRFTTDLHHYNQALLLQTGIDESFSLEELNVAIGELLAHHDILRLTFDTNGPEVLGNYQDITKDFVANSCQWIEWEQFDDKTFEQYVQLEIERQQQQFNLTTGPLARFVAIRNVQKNQMFLFVVIHHLLVDAYSWNIIEEDLNILLRNAQQNKKAILGQKSQSYDAWTKRIAQCNQDGYFANELDYWRRQFPEGPQSADFFNNASNYLPSAENEIVLLDSDLARELVVGNTHETFNTNVVDIVLCAFLLAFTEKVGSHGLHVMMESHGRSNSGVDLDVSRTIGWFTSMYPLYLQLGGTATLTDLLKSVKEQLRNVPQDGLGYGVLKYNEKSCDLDRPEPKICFNYFGKIFQGEKSVTVNSGLEKSEKILRVSSLNHLAQFNTRSISQERVFQIEIVGMEVEDGIAFNIIYNTQAIDKPFITDIINKFKQGIVNLIQICKESQGGFTPSDLADLDMNQSDIDALINEKLAGLTI